MFNINTMAKPALTKILVELYKKCEIEQDCDAYKRYSMYKQMAYANRKESKYDELLEQCLRRDQCDSFHAYTNEIREKIEHIDDDALYDSLGLPGF